MSEKSPTMPLYVRDIISSNSIAKMEDAEFRIYMFLLFAAWLEDDRGTLPNDDRELAALARVSRQKWIACKDAVMKQFRVRKDGRLVNERLESVSKLSYKRSAAAKGAKVETKVGAKPLAKSDTNVCAKLTLSLSLSFMDFKKSTPAVWYESMPKETDQSIIDELITISKWYHLEVKQKSRKLGHLQDKKIVGTIYHGMRVLEALIRIDKYPKEEVITVVKHLIESHDPGADFNWMDQIQSLRTIRDKTRSGIKKYEAVRTSMLSEGNSKGKSKSTRHKADDEDDRSQYEDIQ